MKFKLVIVSFWFGCLSQAQTALPVSRTVWDSTPTGWTDSPLDSYTTVFACSDSNGAKFDTTGNCKTVHFTGVPDKLSFTVKSIATTTSSILIEESADGSTYTTIENLSGTTNLPTTCTVKGDYSLLPTSSYIRWTFTKGSQNMTMDDVSITSLSLLPTLTVLPTSRSGFTYVVGNGPSAEQSFSVTGTNLNADLVVNAPLNYEISTTSGTGFTNLITLIPISGTVAATTIYTRLKVSLTIGNYNESIIVKSTGASNKDLTLSGTTTGSLASDIIAVPSSEAVLISTTMNDAPPLTATTGIQVWQFKIRDGGALMNDSDNLPTILTGFTLAQGLGNEVGTWTDAIRTIALFDGTTFIANGTVSKNQIQFSGLSVLVADNTEKTLSLRLSLKCLLGADAFDREDFQFSLSSANTIFSATGSGKTNFLAQTSANALNAISVVATKLLFQIQPVTTGINGPMNPFVEVRATDNCGNLDVNYTGLVSITSTGTLSNTTNTASTVNGIAIFNTLIHRVFGTGLTLNANAVGLTNATSTLFNIENVTVLQAGDLALLAFNTGVDPSGDDEISFVNLVEILPSTRIDITDNAFQKCGTTNGWGISEGWIRLERKNTPLPAGTIVTVRIKNGTPSIFSPDPAEWTTSKPQPLLQGEFNLNNDGEQIFFMSGGEVGGLNANNANSDAGTYSGNIIFGFNTKGNIWTPVCGNSVAGGTQNSDKPFNFDCLLTWPTKQADLNKYTGLLTPATKREWIERINKSTNWTGYSNNTDYNAGPNYYSGSITITSGDYINGIWIGNISNNWFDCANWQSLKVPDENTNVIIGINAIRNLKVESTSENSDKYLVVAKCKNFEVSNQSIELLSDPNNILHVYGNLSIVGSGNVNMDDGNSATNDGSIEIFGNWTNTVGTNSFLEGNGTVRFIGTATQVINSNVHSNPEEFYNVILDNDFSTQDSNNLIAKGNLIVNSSKTVTVNTKDFIQVSKNLINNGIFNIKDTGQLIQVDDTGVNSGSGYFSMQRTASVDRNTDYVYWSSSVSNFPVGNVNPDSWLLYKWIPTIPRDYASDFGDWQETPKTEIMEKGKGYIIRGPYANPTATFTNLAPNNLPNNGIIPVDVVRSDYHGADYTYTLGTNTLSVIKEDDNYNLLGNPYPSAIDLKKFLAINTNLINGVRLWTHGTSILPSTINGQSFYNSFTHTYTTADYITATVLGSSTGPGDYAIASGQGFFVTLDNFAPNPGTVTFNNSMRSDPLSGTIYNNSIFYRKKNNEEEKTSRIWLDIIDNLGSSARTLVGYIQEATLLNDRLFDASLIIENELNIYSLINDEPQIIQGRPLPLDQKDLVPIGVIVNSKSRTPLLSNTTYTIAIGTVDGLFKNTMQPIYLEDKVLNVIHDLRQQPYVFNSENGRFDDRFTLRYTNNSLKKTHYNSIVNSVEISSNTSEIRIKSPLENLKLVTIYDILGRKIYNNKPNNKDLIIKNIEISQSVLIVNITLEDGQVISKKIIH